MNIFHHNHSHNDSELTRALSDSANKQSSRIRRVVIVGCIINALLMILKLTAGYFGHSDALMADGYHSLNDFGADLIMLLFIGISFKKADGRYSYGYGKYETFSTFLISVFLLFVAVHISEEAIESIIEYNRGVILPQPDIWTVVVVVISMFAKEFLFRYYRHGAKTTSTMALLTNAWHHRSDAMASVATLIGVSFAHFLGEPWRILDPIASLVLVVFIVVAAFRMLKPAFIELMDHSCNGEMVVKAENIVKSIPGVRSLIHTKSRKNGHFYIFDFTIGIDPKLTVEEGWKISETIQERLHEELGKNMLISVNTAPCKQ